jgi:hypothetical protein
MLVFVKPDMVQAAALPAQAIASSMSGGFQTLSKKLFSDP